MDVFHRSPGIQYFFKLTHEISDSEILNAISQSMEDGVIMETGQLVQKSVEAEKEQGRECVTTLLQLTEEQSVREPVPRLNLVTNSLVQVRI